MLSFIVYSANARWLGFLQYYVLKTNHSIAVTAKIRSYA